MKQSIKLKMKQEVRLKKFVLRSLYNCQITRNSVRLYNNILNVEIKFSFLFHRIWRYVTLHQSFLPYFQFSLNTIPGKSWKCKRLIFRNVNLLENKYIS